MALLAERNSLAAIHRVKGVKEETVMAWLHIAAASVEMNGRLVRKTLSYSKQLAALKVACAWEDWVYNLTRSVDTLSLPVQIGQQRWKR